MNETSINYIDLTNIRPSKTNPRKSFDSEKLKELAESIRTQGVIQPLLVRPAWCMGKSSEEIANVNGNAPSVEFYELVAGERRYRAAGLAELATVPVIFRLLGDQDTLELQLIENLQRDDLDPFEEAAGYQQLLDLRDGHGQAIHTIDTISRRVSKPRRRVYYRLKLLKVPADVRAAVADGFSVQAAELIGSIPTPELRAAATEEILHPDMEAGPLPIRRVREVISDRYMRSLSGAPFDQSAPLLVPVLEDDQTGERIGGGACTDCPMRTGNMEAIIGKTKRPDVCTNPLCYLKKCDAQFSLLQETAAKEGKRILTMEEASSVFQPDGSLLFGCPYVVTTARPHAEEVSHTGKVPRWQELLAGLESRPQLLVARDPRGKIVELVDHDLAIEAVNLAAKQKGEKSIFDRSSRRPLSPNRASSAATSTNGDTSGDEEPEWKRQDRKNKEVAKFNFQVTLAGMTQLIGAIDKLGMLEGFWDAIIRASIDHAGHDGCWLICKRLGLDPKAENGHTNRSGVEGAALEYGLTLPDEKLKLGFLVELLLSQRVKIYNSGSLGGLRSVEAFKMFAKLYGVDVSEVERGVKAVAKTKDKPKPAAEAAKDPTTKAAKHEWEKITGNKFRCKGCGAAAVKQKGKFTEEKAVRGKPCTLSESAPAPKKSAKKKPADRKKRTVARTIKKKGGKK
jgi:ParB/RepB/Spo0J family partition protein